MGLFHSRTIYTSRPKSVRANLESALLAATDWEWQSNSVKELVDPALDALFEARLTPERSIELVADDEKREVRGVVDQIQQALSIQGLNEKARAKLLEKRRRSSLSSAALGPQASEIFASLAIEKIQEQKQQQQQQHHQHDHLSDWSDSDDESDVGEEHSRRSFQSLPEQQPNQQQQQQQQLQYPQQQEFQPTPYQFQNLQVQPDHKQEQDHLQPPSMSSSFASSSPSSSSSSGPVLPDLSVERKNITAKFLFIHSSLEKLVQSAVYCYRVKMKTNTMLATLKKKKKLGNGNSIDLMKSQEEIDAENLVLKEALANHDRARVTIEWMKQDYELCVAMFKARRQLKYTTLARNFVSKQQSSGAHQFHQLAPSPSNTGASHSWNSASDPAGSSAGASAGVGASTGGGALSSGVPLPTPAPPLAQLEHLIWQLNEYISQIQTSIRAHEQTAITLGLHYLDRNESGQLTPRDVDDLPAQYWLLMDPKRRNRVRPDQLQKAIEAEGKKLQDVQRKIKLLEEDNVKISVAGHTGTGENQAKIYKNNHEIQALQVLANQHSSNLSHLNSFFLSAFVKHVFHHLSLSLIPAASAAASQFTIESLMLELKGVETCTTKDPVGLTQEETAQIEAKEEIEQYRRGGSAAGSRVSSRMSGASSRQSGPIHRTKNQMINSQFNGGGPGSGNHLGSPGMGMMGGMGGGSIDGAGSGVTTGTGMVTAIPEERSPAVRRSSSTPYYMESRQVDDSDQRFTDRDRPPSVNRSLAPPSIPSQQQTQSQSFKPAYLSVEKEDAGRRPSMNSKTNETIEEERWRGETGEPTSRNNPPRSPRSLSSSRNREPDMNETNAGLPVASNRSNQSADNLIHRSPLPPPDPSSGELGSGSMGLAPVQYGDVTDNHSKSQDTGFPKQTQHGRMVRDTSFEKDPNSTNSTNSISSRREIEGVRFHDD